MSLLLNLACCAAVAVSGHGLRMELPDTWAGHVSRPREPGALPHLEAMRAGGPRLVLAEVGNRPGTWGFRRTRLPIAVQRKHFVEDSVARRRFSSGGRSFSLRVNFAARPVSTAQIAEVNRVLGTLKIAPLFTSRTWTVVRRPLRLRRVPPGSPCPRSKSGRAAPAASFTLGSGPAYPVLGSRRGIASLADDPRRGDLFLHKTLWAVAPRYRGQLLVRGGRIDRPGRLRFHLGGPIQHELRVPPVPAWETARWRYLPSATAVSGAGCYAFQVDGLGFSRILLWEARR